MIPPDELADIRERAKADWTYHRTTTEQAIICYTDRKVLLAEVGQLLATVADLRATVDELRRELAKRGEVS